MLRTNDDMERLTAVPHRQTASEVTDVLRSHAYCSASTLCEKTILSSQPVLCGGGGGAIQCFTLDEAHTRSDPRVGAPQFCRLCLLPPPLHQLPDSLQQPRVRTHQPRTPVVWWVRNVVIVGP